MDECNQREMIWIIVNVIRNVGNSKREVVLSWHFLPGCCPVSVVTGEESQRLGVQMVLRA